MKFFQAVCYTHSWNIPDFLNKLCVSNNQVFFAFYLNHEAKTCWESSYRTKQRLNWQRFDVSVNLKKISSLFAKVISPKAKGFAKLWVFFVSLRTNFKVLNKALVIKIENTVKSCYEQICLVCASKSTTTY